jgi:hypothetical protein
VSLVQRIATPLSDVGIAHELGKAHEDVYAGHPSPELLGCLWAQVCLEHARGKCLFNHNYGNITCGRDYPGDFYTLTTDEQVRPGEWQSMSLRYRAYGAHRTGAAEYIRFLEGHCESALNLFRRGKALEGAHRLKELGYYTADVEPYAKSMVSLYNEFHRRRLSSERPSPIPETHAYEIDAACFTERTLHMMDGARAGHDGIDVIDSIKVSER